MQYLLTNKAQAASAYWQCPSTRTRSARGAAASSRALLLPLPLPLSSSSGGEQEEEQPPPLCSVASSSVKRYRGAIVAARRPLQLSLPAELTSSLRTMPVSAASALVNRARLLYITETIKAVGYRRDCKG